MSRNIGPHSFLESAMLQARSISAARSDLPYFVFPKSNFPVDEHLTASVKNSLYMMVFNIERSILRLSNMENRIEDKSLSYPLLVESGLLNDRNILDAALSLFHYQKILCAENNVHTELPKTLMQHEDMKIKECAQMVSLANSRFKSLGLGDYYELPPEDLHRLTWRIVATFEMIDKTIDGAMIEATNQWLKSYSEADTIAASSRKLVYLMRTEDRSEYWQFKPDYASLFIALLEQETTVNRQVIMTILADRSPTLCAILFRAANIDLRVALDNILTIFYQNEDNRYSQIISQIHDEYLTVSPSEALEEIINWSTSSIVGASDA